MRTCGQSRRALFVGVKAQAELDGDLDPFAEPAAVAACICAAGKVERSSRAPADACTPEWQAHWLAAVRTACLQCCRGDFRDAVARVPEYAHLFDSDAVRVRFGSAFVDSLPAMVHGRFAADQRL